MSPPLATELSVRQIGDDEFLSNNLPVRMGNARPIAYGGSTLGIACNAAHATVPPTHRLYSMLGHYLGPAAVDQPLRCRVARTRSTASFATRRVEVLQRQRDGSNRAVMEVICDFHVPEQPLLTYSAPPSATYAGHDESPVDSEVAASLLADGHISKGQHEAVRASFAANERHFETRVPPTSYSGQNLHGIAKSVARNREAPITDKRSAEWYRARDAAPSDADSAAVLAFLMDGGLSFLPLAHSDMFLNEAGPCSSLDFALRLFQPTVDLSSWHFRERLTSAAGHGRSYTESKLWDDKGNMVACMTQQGILRPLKPKAAL